MSVYSTSKHINCHAFIWPHSDLRKQTKSNFSFWSGWVHWMVFFILFYFSHGQSCSFFFMHPFPIKNLWRKRSRSEIISLHFMELESSSKIPPFLSLAKWFQKVFIVYMSGWWKIIQEIRSNEISPGVTKTPFPNQAKLTLAKEAQWVWSELGSDRV